MEAAGRRRELVERANFFEQRATEYLKATKSRRLGWAGRRMGAVRRARTPMSSFSWAAGPTTCRWVSDALDDDDLQLARAVLLAVSRGLEVLGRFVAGDRLLEARELDDDEAVEFLRAPRILNLPPRARNLPPNF